MADPAELAFFDRGSIATLGVASVAVTVVANAAGVLLPRLNRALVAFAASVAVAFAGAYLSGKLAGVVDVFLAFLNACLLFCTALGIQSAAGARPGAPAGGVGETRPRAGLVPLRRGWFAPWLG